MKITVSGHAYGRIRSRGKHLVQIYAQDAYENGELPGDKFMERLFKKWVSGKYENVDFRVHNGLIWVYETSTHGVKKKLITVYPAK